MVKVNLPLLEVSGADYGDDEAAMVDYRADGTARAMAMDNRGPIRYDANGKLHPDILDAYSRAGFYVFEDVLGEAERADLERDVADILDRAPVAKDAKLDKHGRPALGVDCQARTVGWVKPLSDPNGGTDAAYGRHPSKMNEPTPPSDAPEHVVQVVLGSLQFSDACLRMYGHPDLLAVTEAINGPDFTPFNDIIWIKHPRLGASVAWHQDGWTHWKNPELDENTHGFNMMAQLYGCDAANGLWVVPGSHRMGKVDIKAMVEVAGSDRLPEAVPLICAPGDVAITNRQAIHGSFANTSPNVRVTINVGSQRRKFVLGVTSGGLHSPVALYDDDYIRQRSRVIMYGIDARRQRYPEETSYVYAPLADREEQYRWNDAAKADMKDYNMQDLGI